MRMIRPLSGFYIKCTKAQQNKSGYYLINNNEVEIEKLFVEIEVHLSASVGFKEESISQVLLLKKKNVPTFVALEHTGVCNNMPRRKTSAKKWRFLLTTDLTRVKGHAQIINFKSTIVQRRVSHETFRTAVTLQK